LNYDPARIDEHVNKAMEDYGTHITAALERYLPVLSTVSTVAPMLGSLGTVVGMVILFTDVVDKFGTQNIILTAAAGIKLKLIVTVWGLMVGIPAFIAFNYFTAVVNRYILEAEETASQLIEALGPRLADEAAEAAKLSPRMPAGSMGGTD
jgi:biopolymer transport protein ExbB